MPTCVDCDAAAKTRGLCSRHYQHRRYHQLPLPPPALRAAYDPGAHIDTTSGPTSCWPWTGTLDRDGYGVFKTAGRQHRAHRWALATALGRQLPPDELALHSCDNRRCCNPAHLRLGDALANSHDAVTRGRLSTGDDHWTRTRLGDALKGERNASAELTEVLVREIRRRYGAGETQTSLARAFGVTQSHVSGIVRYRSWRHLE